MGDESIRATPSIPPASAQQGHRNRYTQFKSYLRRNLIYMQRQICATEQQLSDETRTQALHTLSYALAEQELWPLVRELLWALAPKMELGGHREDWLPYLTQGLEQSRVMADPSAMAECHLQLGLLYRLLSNFGAAREQLVASIALAQEFGEARQQARALNELAWLEQLQEEYEAAAAHVQQALRLLEDDDPEVGICYRVLGMIAIGYKQWKKAEELHTKALEKFELAGDMRRTAWSLHNLAYVQYGQEQYKAAITIYQKAADILYALNDKYYWATVQINLGITYYYDGDSEKAIQCYQRAMEVAQDFRDRLQFARIYTNYGLAYLSQHKYKKAQDAFMQSAKLHKELGNLSLSLNATDGLAMAYLAQQQYLLAIQTIKEAVELLPQIQNSPNYAYLFNSLQKHLNEAEQKQGHQSKV